MSHVRRIRIIRTTHPSPLARVPSARRPSTALPPRAIFHSFLNQRRGREEGGGQIQRALGSNRESRLGLAPAPSIIAVVVVVVCARLNSFWSWTGGTVGEVQFGNMLGIWEKIRSDRIISFRGIRVQGIRIKPHSFVHITFGENIHVKQILCKKAKEPNRDPPVWKGD